MAGIVLLVVHFVGKSAGACVFWMIILGVGRVFGYSIDSQAGRITFLAGYNHSVYMADFRGYGFIP
jgi:hypothetical protein